MSSCQTSMAASLPASVESLDWFVDCRMSVLAASPRPRLRTARMVFAAPRRTKWRAASRPRPALAPVTMTVRPAQEEEGMGSLKRSWLYKNSPSMPGL